MTLSAPVARMGARIGPGRLVLVVGPSGAGKDTLIRAAREVLAGDDHYVFPQRFVTRPASSAEDNIEITREVFETLCKGDGFAAHWTAHGLGYGLPLAIDGDIAKGRAVICNVSRTVLPDLRTRYTSTSVIEVTAPPDVLETRLTTRGRDRDGDLALRVRRSNAVGEVRADVVISNDRDCAVAARAFVEALR